MSTKREIGQAILAEAREIFFSGIENNIASDESMRVSRSDGTWFAEISDHKGRSIVSAAGSTVAEAMGKLIDTVRNRRFVLTADGAPIFTGTMPKIREHLLSTEDMTLPAALQHGYRVHALES